ncbi:MAG: YopX family protein [Bacteroidales bacterium]
MREILFRGKLYLNRKWIYGMPSYDLQYIFNDENLDSPDNFMVNPGTVTQFTGITDKNGIKLFEGDILQYTAHPGYLMKSCLMTVCFDTQRACFGYQSTEHIHPDYINPFSDHDELESDVLSHCEIIGNIHDNPELLIAATP